MSYSISEILKKIKSKGIIHYFKYFLGIILRSLRPKWQRVFIFELPLIGIVPNEYHKTITVSVLKEINEPLLSFANQRGSWYTLQAKDLFSKGNLCFVAIIDEKIASCLWTSFNVVYLPDIEYKLAVAKDIAPLIDGYTLDEYRGRGLY